MALANRCFDGPYPGRPKNAGERGVLAQAAGLLAVRLQNVADFLKRPLQNGFPFLIATDEGWRVLVLA